MNTLVFLAGMGAGIVLFLLILGLVLAIDRRIKKEQRDANTRANELMEEGNRLRERRAAAMDRIANYLEIQTERKS